ncbi:FAD-containing oxidoreductase [bacterium]|nr:FAD-containing oxidoreductase [bacterium]
MTHEYGKIMPMDAYNESLLANVHPTDWQNPTPSGRYNMVVLGAGTAGLVTAAICAGLGAKVALVERHLLGGDCLNTGCVPSKALISAARMASACRSAADFGIRNADQPDVDFAAVMERVRRLRSGISTHDSAQRFRDLGVDVFIGDGRFVDRSNIEVNGARLTFKKALIATGARAAVPPIDGLAEAGFLTNETIFSLTKRPETMAIIGGGPIGCELAQAFQRLGVQVTLIESGAQFLPREDKDAAAILAHALRRDGVRVLLGAQIMRVEQQDESKIIDVGCSTTDEKVTVEQILVGTGRLPNVEGIGLETAGVKFDLRKGVLVDDTLRTENPAIFAAGDVCSAYKFTHTADFGARIVVQNALFPFLPKKKFSKLVLPWCTYTDPEIAHTGAYEQELHDRGTTFDTLFVPLESVDRALLEGHTDGFLKVHTAPNGTILGATLVAPHAGDLISEVTLAMNGKLKIGIIGGTIHPYPTQGDIIRKAADAFNRKKLTPGRQRLLAWLMARLR